VGSLTKRASAADLALRVCVDNDVPDVYCDESQVDRILRGLVIATMRSAEPGETLVVDAHVSESQDNVEIVVQRERLADEPPSPDAGGLGDRHPAASFDVLRQIARSNLGQLLADSRDGWLHGARLRLATAQPAAIIAAYLAASQTHENSPQAVSLLTADLDGDAVKWLPVADEFLQRSFGVEDLVYCVSASGWFIATRRPSVDFVPSLCEISTQWSRYAADLPTHGAPELRIAVSVTYPPEAHAAQVVAGFLSLAERELARQLPPREKAAARGAADSASAPADARPPSSVDRPEPSDAKLPVEPSNVWELVADSLCESQEWSAQEVRGVATGVKPAPAAHTPSATQP